MSIQTDRGEVKGKLSAEGQFLFYQGHESRAGDKGQNRIDKSPMEGGNHRTSVKIMVGVRVKAPRTQAGGTEGRLKFCWPSHPPCVGRRS